MFQNFYLNVFYCRVISGEWNIKNLFQKIIFSYVCVCWGIHASECWYPWMWESSMSDPSGAEVTGGREPPDVSTGKSPRSSVKVVLLLSC